MEWGHARAFPPLRRTKALTNVICATVVKSTDVPTLRTNGTRSSLSDFSSPRLGVAVAPSSKENFNLPQSTVAGNYYCSKLATFTLFHANTVMRLAVCETLWRGTLLSDGKYFPGLPTNKSNTTRKFTSNKLICNCGGLRKWRCSSRIRFTVRRARKERKNRTASLSD